MNESADFWDRSRPLHSTAGSHRSIVKWFFVTRCSTVTCSAVHTLWNSSRSWRKSVDDYITTNSWPSQHACILEHWLADHLSSVIIAQHRIKHNRWRQSLYLAVSRLMQWILSVQYLDVNMADGWSIVHCEASQKSFLLDVNAFMQKHEVLIESLHQCNGKSFLHVTYSPISIHQPLNTIARQQTWWTYLRTKGVEACFFFYFKWSSDTWVWISVSASYYIHTAIFRIQFSPMIFLEVTRLLLHFGWTPVHPPYTSAYTK
jgi:hypothetical protein